MSSLISSLTKRRTNYALGKNITASNKEIVDEIRELIVQVPTAFNMQSSRVIIAFGSNHEKIWQITKDILKKIVAPDNFAGTAKKIDSFAAAYGTILYFEETETIKAMQKQFATYADNFPIWGQQANGMLQLAVWTALTDMGLGVNLQHYNPLIDKDVKKLLAVPDSWQLISQMPFGQILQTPDKIEKMDAAQRVKVFE